MRSLIRFASIGFFSLSIALGTIGAVVGVADQARASDDPCYFEYDPDFGIVCKAYPCGFLNLKNCKHVIYLDVYGQVVGQACICP